MALGMEDEFDKVVGDGNCSGTMASTGGAAAH